MNLSFYLRPHININSSWIIDLCAKGKTVNRLKENSEDYCCNFVIGRDLFKRYQNKTLNKHEKLKNIELSQS